MRIAVVGLRWDGAARLIRTLAEAGHYVTALHEGAVDDSPIPEERLAELEPVRAAIDFRGDEVGYHWLLRQQGWHALARDLPAIGVMSSRPLVWLA